MLFNREGSTQARRQNALLAMLLAGVAGSVNAMGFYLLGTHTSHVSGKVAELGEALASGQGGMALAAGKLLLAFFLGAVSCTLLLDAARARTRGRHTATLLLEVLTLAGVAFWAVRGARGLSEPTLAWGLCYAMGLQNALVTRVSGAVVRTTHVTGMVTDLGIELVRMGTWVRDHARGHGLLGLLRALRALLSAVEFERAWLHVFLLSSFLGGCVAGGLLFARYGALALAMPCILLVLLVGLDWRPRRAGAEAAAAPNGGPAPFLAPR
jgi:uncharacterized membrane protein YoaK (UPF0700 family)